MSVSFDCTPADRKLIDACIDRADQLGLLDGWYDRLTATMDLVACNANGCPMDFQRLLDADDFNFMHDITGIANTMDRDTGKLARLFLPRMAKKEAVQ